MPLTRMKSYRPKAQAPRFGQPARWRGRAMQQSREHFFIGNQWVAPSSGRRFTLTNASTEEAIGTVPEAIEADVDAAVAAARKAFDGGDWRSEEHTSQLQSLMRISYSVFCLKNKNHQRLYTLHI